jgi:hypothetical protein
LTAPLATPLATSVQTGAGTWATVPMGDLAQPLNTFWQLLLRRSGSATWSDDVQATATATNGGLVLAPAGRSLLVGVRPSNQLTFSPLISTGDAGRSWSDGLIDSGLAARPEALALGPDGGTLAVVGNHRSTEVLAGAGTLSSWQTLVSVRELDASPSARGCRPTEVTAVGYASNGAVLGTSCSRAGGPGIFVRTGTTWRLTGPRLPAATEEAEVLGLVPGGGDLVAVVGLSGPKSRALMAAWTTDGNNWHAGAPLPLADGDRLASFGEAAGTAIFALISRPGSAPELEVARGPGGQNWRPLPSPPVGTATVAFGPGPTIDALAVDRTVLTVWALAASSHRWQRAQVVHVAIQFGSSS